MGCLFQCLGKIIKFKKKIKNNFVNFLNKKKKQNKSKKYHIDKNILIQDESIIDFDLVSLQNGYQTRNINCDFVKIQWISNEKLYRCLFNLQNDKILPIEYYKTRRLNRFAKDYIFSRAEILFKDSNNQPKLVDISNWMESWSGPQKNFYYESPWELTHKQLFQIVIDEFQDNNKLIEKIFIYNKKSTLFCIDPCLEEIFHF